MYRLDTSPHGRLRVVPELFDAITLQFIPVGCEHLTLQEGRDIMYVMFLGLTEQTISGSEQVRQRCETNLFFQLGTTDSNRLWVLAIL